VKAARRESRDVAVPQASSHPGWFVVGPPTPHWRFFVCRPPTGTGCVGLFFGLLGRVFRFVVPPFPLSSFFPIPMAKELEAPSSPLPANRGPEQRQKKSPCCPTARSQAADGDARILRAGHRSRGHADELMASGDFVLTKHPESGHWTSGEVVPAR